MPTQVSAEQLDFYRDMRRARALDFLLGGDMGYAPTTVRRWQGSLAEIKERWGGRFDMGAFAPDGVKYGRPVID